MFDISWGEIFVVTGVGLALIGRRDLPKAANAVGTQVGRIVGFLQGARARADRYAANSQMQQLQNELRSGLRELDAVKSELAVSMSPTNMVGRNLGSLTANADKKYHLPASRAPTAAIGTGGVSQSPATAIQASSTLVEAPEHHSTELQASQEPSTSSVYETTAAVAEAEWSKQGIGYASSAEAQTHGGSGQLANLFQQSLIFDRYDRVVAQQDSILQSKVETIRDKMDAAKNRQRNQPRGKSEE